MPCYLVTGRAGSGKTTVAAELRRREYAAFDTDTIKGLSGWLNASTGLIDTISDNRFVDLSIYSWVWDPAVLTAFIENNPNAFICGGAENDFKFDHLFKKHFVLSIKPAAQIQRLIDRTTNEYGKDPAMHKRILEKQLEHEKTARLHSAIIIDAEQPIDIVVDAILREII
jgi:adenylate kinase family enzyme